MVKKTRGETYSKGGYESIWFSNREEIKRIKEQAVKQKISLGKIFRKLLQSIYAGLVYLNTEQDNINNYDIVVLFKKKND